MENNMFFALKPSLQPKREGWGTNLPLFPDRPTPAADSLTVYLEGSDQKEGLPEEKKKKKLVWA